MQTAGCGEILLRCIADIKADASMQTAALSNHTSLQQVREMPLSFKTQAHLLLSAAGHSLQLRAHSAATAAARRWRLCARLYVLLLHCGSGSGSTSEPLLQQQSAGSGKPLLRQ